MNRRTLLMGMAAAPLLASLAPMTSQASTRYSTVILAPHQDDEVLRLLGYSIFMADRGDNLALVTATNGSATQVGRDLRLTKAQVTRIRDREQRHAWEWVTDGRGGTPVNLGFQDGQAQAGAIHASVLALLAQMDGKPEVYVAAYPPDRKHSYLPSARGGDNHPDHIACVEAGRMLTADGVTVRYAIHPSRTSETEGTAAYKVSDDRVWSTRGLAAIEAYSTIGQRSVPEEFEHLRETRGRSVVAR